MQFPEPARRWDGPLFGGFFALQSLRMSQMRRGQGVGVMVLKAPRRSRALLRRGPGLFALFLLGLAALLVIARLLLPLALRLQVDRTLDAVADYRGRCDRVSVSLWRGAYRIHGARLSKASGRIATPFFQADRIELSLDWQALLRGKLLGKAVIEGAALELKAGASESETQLRLPLAWTRQAAGLFPLPIDTLEIRSGEIRLEDARGPAVARTRLRAVDALAKGLTSPRLTAWLIGRPLRHGLLRVDLWADPSASPPAFQLAASLREAPAVELSEELRPYGGFNADDGLVGIFLDANVQDGRVSGYVRPTFEGLLLSSWQKTRDPLASFWHTATGTALPRNLDRLSAKIRFAGPVGGTEDDALTAAARILKKGFLLALLPGYASTPPAPPKAP